jgi:uncharacterized membrane protein (DUF373 family)
MVVLDRFVELARKALVVAVIIMLLVVVVFIFVGLTAAVYDMIFLTPFIYEKSDFLSIFGWLLLVVIGLELLDAIYVIIKKHEFHVETVLLVAVTAVARELIVYDYEYASGIVLAGMALVMAGIATAYYFITKTQQLKVEKVREKAASTVPDTLVFPKIPDS